MEIGMLVANTPSGLHVGHRAVIEYGKQFGNVTVAAVENIGQRNRYLLRGEGSEKYKVDLTKMKADCDEMGVNLKLQPYIKISDESRAVYYDKARTFVEGYRRELLSPRYVQAAICSVMTHLIYNYSKPGTAYVWMPDLMVSGPDVLGFFYNVIAELENWPKRKILPQVVKGKYGIKESSAFSTVRHDFSGLREAVEKIRKRYRPGPNRELVRSANKPLKKQPWRIHEILVYEGGFVQGRLEVTAFSFVAEGKVDVVEEIDYEP